MSGLYNLLHGHHPAAGGLLSLLGITKENIGNIPRFRDIMLFEDSIQILTRTGGNNRDDYPEGNEFLTTLVGYRSNHDDGFDNTYAWWVYDWPTEPTEIVEGLQAMLVAIKDKRPDLVMDNMKDKTDDALARMEKGMKQEAGNED